MAIIMTSTSIWRRAYGEVVRPAWWFWVLGVMCSLCLFYPTNHAENYYESRRGQGDTVVETTEHALRYINTILNVAMPVILRDPIGLVQLGYVAIAGTVATQGLKRLLDAVIVQDTRLGQRPLRPDSHHNMPSGHSSLAACGALFVMRRYGWGWGVLLLPILGLTMYARVMLDAHTISAVLAGALLGIGVTLFFTSPRSKQSHTTQSIIQ